MDSRPKPWRITGWLLVPVLLVVAAGAWLALDPGFRWTRSSSDLSQDAFGQRVREYLLAHPEIVMQAAQRFEARQQVHEESETQQVVKARAEEILRDPNSPVGGNSEGDVSLIEFFDYNCPYCRRVAAVMTDAEKSDPQLRIVYKEFPILGTNSTFAAKAALAAHRQGKYLALHQALMQARSMVDEAQVLDAATRIGVDVERMRSDMNDPAIEAAIEKNLELARALRINGTPSFVIGEQVLRGATDLRTLRGMIDEARKVRN